MIKENEDIKASSFTQELPEDPSQLNQSRIVEKACFSRVNPEKFSNGSLVHINPLLQAEMGLETLNERELLMLT
ncbi:MAG: hypothetical protein QNL21_01135, partial [Flavobacteriales bacterium]